VTSTPSSPRPPSAPRSRTEWLRASPPLSRSSFVERALRVSPVAPVVVFAPAAIGMAILALSEIATLVVLAWWVGGYLFWTLTEYWLHRVVLHLEPERGLGARLHWMFHGAHHEHPNSPEFVVAPPIVSVPLGALFCLAFFVVLGSPAWLAFASGFIVGYVVYDVTHYRLHQGRPRTWIGRKLREQHMRHHFQDGTRSFGVTAPWWDHVFGTARPRRRGRRAGARA
jgi:dihydroceramide fatty acyl 2-hydroxylase